LPTGTALLPQAPILFASGRVGFAAGGTILATADSGRNWHLVGAASQFGAKLTGATFLSATFGWGLDQNGLPWRTVDGGRTWQPVALPAGLSPPLVQVAAFGFTDRDHGYMLISDGSWLDDLYQSFDGGRSWHATFQGVVAAAFAPGSDAWLIANDTLYRSLADGSAWRPVATGIPANFIQPGSLSLAVPPQSPGAVWLYDAVGGELAVSVDGGRSFRISRLPLKDAETVAGEPMPSSPEAGMLQMDGGLWRTQDMGRIWRLAGRLP
jgi:photosystem II stability/assembly factor-like uncharacterized protein